MTKSPKSRGAAKEAIEPEAPITFSEIVEKVGEIPVESLESIEEKAEEARHLLPAPAPDLRTRNEIYVTISPYSSAYKRLAIQQHKDDPSLARGAIILLGKQFDPGKTYRVEKTLEVDKLIKDGLLTSMTGSFRFRVRDEPKVKEVA
jgi:hypothetical protein